MRQAAVANRKIIDGIEPRLTTINSPYSVPRNFYCESENASQETRSCADPAPPARRFFRLSARRRIDDRGDVA
jgi:hypothetical protein